MSKLFVRSRPVRGSRRPWLQASTNNTKADDRTDEDRVVHDQKCGGGRRVIRKKIKGE